MKSGKKQRLINGTVCASLLFSNIILTSSKAYANDVPEPEEVSKMTVTPAVPVDPPVGASGEAVARVNRAISDAITSMTDHLLASVELKTQYIERFQKLAGANLDAWYVMEESAFNRLIADFLKTFYRAADQQSLQNLLQEAEAAKRQIYLMHYLIDKEKYLILLDNVSSTSEIKNILEQARLDAEQSERIHNFSQDCISEIESLPYLSRSEKNSYQEAIRNETSIPPMQALVDRAKVDSAVYAANHKLTLLPRLLADIKAYPALPNTPDYNYFIEEWNKDSAVIRSIIRELTGAVHHSRPKAPGKIVELVNTANVYESVAEVHKILRELAMARSEHPNHSLIEDQFRAFVDEYPDSENKDKMTEFLLTKARPIRSVVEKVVRQLEEQQGGTTEDPGSSSSVKPGSSSSVKPGSSSSVKPGSSSSVKPGSSSSVKPGSSSSVKPGSSSSVKPGSSSSVKPGSSSSVKPGSSSNKGDDRVLAIDNGKIQVTVTFETPLSDVDGLSLVEINDHSLLARVGEKLKKDPNHIKILNVHLLNQGQTVESKGKRQVNITLAGLGETAEIYHLDDNGHLKLIPSSVNGDTISFEIDHFSRFVIDTNPTVIQTKETKEVEKDRPYKTEFTESGREGQEVEKKKPYKNNTDVNLPRTGDQACLYSPIGLLLAILTFFGIKRYRK